MSGRDDSTARQRALTRIAQKYPKVFRLILNEERARFALPPVGTSNPGVKRSAVASGVKPVKEDKK